jgi:hypothetical protein
MASLDKPATNALPGNGVGTDPISELPAKDPGADTKGRYRYQACYAAWMAVGLLGELPSAVAVYCEHQDDVVIEHDDGRCDAIQVKSQDDGIEPLRGNAAPIIKALRRFVELEHQFGERMRKYMVVSIMGFHKKGTTASNLAYCLDQAHICSDPNTPPSPLKSLINKIKVPATIPAEVVLAALRKVELDARLPKLRDAEFRVRRSIESLPEYGHHRATTLHDAAKAIIAIAERAGEATEKTAASDYIAYLDDPEGHANRAAIEAKRLSIPLVRETIDKAVSSSAVLRSADGADASSLPPDAGVAHRKMDAGGLPVHVVALLDDLRASAEDEISRRLYRDGPVAADAAYDHAKVLMTALAEDARLATRHTDERYGTEMYAELRARLDQRLAADGQALAGMSAEHGTGIAAILTELCRVWWSEPFDISAPA